MRAASIRAEQAASAVKLAGLGRRPDFLAGFLLPSVRPNAWGVEFGLTMPFLRPGRARGQSIEAAAEADAVRLAAEALSTARPDGRRGRLRRRQIGRGPGPRLRAQPARRPRGRARDRARVFPLRQDAGFRRHRPPPDFRPGPDRTSARPSPLQSRPGRPRGRRRRDRITEHRHEETHTLDPGAALPALLLAVGCRGGRPVASGPADEDHDHEAAVPSSVTLSPEAVAAADIRTEAAATRLLALRVAAAGRDRVERPPRRPPHGPDPRPARAGARRPGRPGSRRPAPGRALQPGLPDPPGRIPPGRRAAQAARRRSGRRGAGPGASWPAPATGSGCSGVTDAEIEALGASSAPRPLLAVRAPLAGTVLEANVVAGDAAELGTSLFRLADPSSLWACLHIQERDLAAVKAGAEVVPPHPGLSGRGLPRPARPRRRRRREPRRGRSRGGSRSPTAAGRLKPGMFVEATSRRPESGRPWSFPKRPLQDDAGQSDRLRPDGGDDLRPARGRDRRAGRTAAVEILEGLAEGEAVVTSGGFLLKSELRKGSLEDDMGTH